MPEEPLYGMEYVTTPILDLIMRPDFSMEAFKNVMKVMLMGNDELEELSNTMLRSRNGR